MGEYYPTLFLIGFSLFIIIGDIIFPRDKEIQQFSYLSLLNFSIVNSKDAIEKQLDAQWIIMWYWINHTILDRNTYDDFQIKKGIKLSFSIIKPQLTFIGKAAYDKTLQTL